MKGIYKKLKNLGINENLINKLKTRKIVIFDDVLTTGTTFLVCEEPIR